MVTGVEEVTVAAVMVKVAEVAPWGTLMDAGMTTIGLEVESMTMAPPDGAAAAS